MAWFGFNDMVSLAKISGSVLKIHLLLQNVYNEFLGDNDDIITTFFSISRATSRLSVYYTSHCTPVLC